MGNRNIKSSVYTARFDLTFGAVSMHGGDKVRLGMGVYCPLTAPHPSIRRFQGGSGRALDSEIWRGESVDLGPPFFVSKLFHLFFFLFFVRGRDLL